jgi:hypothetical protein
MLVGWGIVLERMRVFEESRRWLSVQVASHWLLVVDRLV